MFSLGSTPFGQIVTSVRARIDDASDWVRSLVSGAESTSLPRLARKNSNTSEFETKKIKKSEQLLDKLVYFSKLVGTKSTRSIVSIGLDSSKSSLCEMEENVQIPKLHSATFRGVRSLMMTLDDGSVIRVQSESGNRISLSRRSPSFGSGFYASSPQETCFFGRHEWDQVERIVYESLQGDDAKLLNLFLGQKRADLISDLPKSSRELYYHGKPVLT